MRTLVFAAAVVAGAALSGQALAQESVEGERHHDGPWQLEAGYRGAIVRDAGYDPFSTNDWLGQLTLAGSRVVVRRGPFSLVAGAAWDYGRSTATARGADSGLTVHRLTVPLSVRYAPVRWLYVFGTIAPGAAYESARIGDSSAQAPLVTDGWVPAVDASAGASWSFADTRPLSWWLTAEAGYGLAAPLLLALSPDGSDPRRTATTNLGSLAMNGSFGRLAVSVAF
jgi:hypothetical protein